MNIPELLSPVGDFECLKAAVQNGADAVYLGASYFNARNSATNFTLNELEQAIEYAKIRGVKVNFVLNILIKEQEFDEALDLARQAYNMGIDAIIVQDLGLVKAIIDNIPKLQVHASTQMTIHSLDGVKQLEKLGIKRVVLSRELSINEIEYINKNANIETEVFVHGALCVSYSGQCLFSSMAGGRSGNRGKCAQPCRLPYKLFSNGQKIREGYLISPRDLYSLEYLPKLIQAGVKSFKIEGRLKTPEYVATVTRIYRKYIDLALSGEEYKIDEKDKIDLMQVFNRGGFSNGHLGEKPNNKLVYAEKPNNMGIYLGEIISFNPNKGYIKLKLENTVEIGDRIAIEESNYTISELMINSANIKSAIKGEIVTLGRMKGDIFKSNKVYKISSKKLQVLAKDSYNGENKRVKIECGIIVKENKPIIFKIYNRYNLEIKSELIPVKAINEPITTERIISQLSKTKNTPFDFVFKTIEIDENIHISSISGLNEIRRNAIEKIEQAIKSEFTRDIPKIEFHTKKIQHEKYTDISVLLNILNKEYDYSKLNVKTLYIHLKYFEDKEYENILNNLCKIFDVYIYMPTIFKKEQMKNYNVKGFVVSNIGQIEVLKQTNKHLIGNYTLNIYNHETIDTLKQLGISRFTISPELDKSAIKNVLQNSTDTEMIVYGKIPVMTSNYCVLGNTNKCNEKCGKLCNKNNYLEDRLGFRFKVISNNSICTIYNCKTLSILKNEFNVNIARIDILDETVEEINEIISNVIQCKRIEGKDYTNGNLNREV